MKTRQLTRSDLPAKRRGAESLNIPVLHNGIEKMICDIHFGDNELCYLFKGKGIPVKISELQLILDNRTESEIKCQIKIKKFKIKTQRKNIRKLQDEVYVLERDLMERF